jgi:hypothetical protein
MAQCRNHFGDRYRPLSGSQCIDNEAAQLSLISRPSASVCPLGRDRMAIRIRVEHSQRLAQRGVRFAKTAPSLVHREQFTRDFREPFTDRGGGLLVRSGVAHPIKIFGKQNLVQIFSIFLEVSLLPNAVNSRVFL